MNTMQFVPPMTPNPSLQGTSRIKPREVPELER